MVSVFTNQTPTTPDASDGAPGLTLGTRIVFGEAGQVTAIRWRFPNTLPGGTVIGLLYSYTGMTELGRANFTAPVAGDWNTATLAPAIQVAQGDEVIAAVWTPDRYVASNGFFANTDIINGLLTAPIDSANDHNGLFIVGASPAYPNNSFNSSCYFADVEFSATGTTYQGAAAMSAVLNLAALGTRAAVATVTLTSAAYMATRATTTPLPVPSAGTTSRPSTGTTGRPDTGRTARP